MLINFSPVRIHKILVVDYLFTVMIHIALVVDSFLPCYDSLNFVVGLIPAAMIYI